MKNTFEIKVTVQHVGELIPHPDSTHYRKRFLDPDIEDYIVKKATGSHANNKFLLHFEFLSTDTVDNEQVTIAVKKNFGNRKLESQESLKQTLRHGRRSAVVAFIFLAIILVLVEINKRLFPENGLNIIFGESLTILGWVALWRPAELLLYEWRPFKREAILFSRLEQSDILIKTGA